MRHDEFDMCVACTVPEAQGSLWWLLPAGLVCSPWSPFSSWGLSSTLAIFLSVPEPPCCTTLGGTVDTVIDVKGAPKHDSRLVICPAGPEGMPRGKIPSCTSVALDAGSPGVPGSSFPQLLVPYFQPPSLPSLQSQPCWEEAPEGQRLRKTPPSLPPPLLVMIICIIYFTIYYYFEHNL